MKFETDSTGNVITKPVTGYAVVPVAGIAVLLCIQYAETPEELESGDSKQIQLVLMPQQALEIAEAVTKRAKILLGYQPAPGEGLN
jgi:hypothetical protein